MSIRLPRRLLPLPLSGHRRMRRNNISSIMPTLATSYIKARLPRLVYKRSESGMKRTTVLLADDHVVLTDCLVNLLRRDFEVVEVARDGRTMIEMAKDKRPDVSVVDISMPHLNGIDAARIL